MSYGSSRTCGQLFRSADGGRRPQGGPACGPSPPPDEPPGPGASSCRRARPHCPPAAPVSSQNRNLGRCQQASSLHKAPAASFPAEGSSPRQGPLSAQPPPPAAVGFLCGPPPSFVGLKNPRACCPSLATFPALNGGIFAPAPPSSEGQHFRPTLSPLPPAPRARCPRERALKQPRESPRTAPSLPAGLASPRQCPGVSQKVRQTRSCPGVARVPSRTRFHSRCRPGTF